jgi:hypothetical protein
MTARPRAALPSGRSTRNRIDSPDSRGSQPACAAYPRARPAGTSAVTEPASLACPAGVHGGGRSPDVRGRRGQLGQRVDLALLPGTRLSIRR